MKIMADTAADRRQRMQLVVSGAVQGVGFRPYVYQLASSMGLTGWVRNTGDGVVIEVEGTPADVALFRQRLSLEAPVLARIGDVSASDLAAAGGEGFRIEESEPSAKPWVQVLPDVATCPDCLAEVFDPDDRRYRYPFTNCTHCGPRWSIIRQLPYDRAQTSMAAFPMCPACDAEYHDPDDRRFHAQPNACPACGPQLSYWDAEGNPLAERDDALRAAAETLRQGQIVAVKGLGGFHLMVDARNEAAVARLRTRKHRPVKALAVMVCDRQAAERIAEISVREAALLTGPATPIVLLRARHGGIAPNVAPENPYIGVMLAYTPLHHLLLELLGFPVVATSGNRVDEPLCTDEWEALDKLAGIADAFLVHDRPILRPVDDSIVQVVDGHAMVLRRARGFAPEPLSLKQSLPPLVAYGAFLKNTVAITRGRDILLSPHVGDLDTPEARRWQAHHIDALCDLYRVEPGHAVCDPHPDYPSTQAAQDSGLPLIQVQHHHAHVAAAMAEHGLDEPTLGVSWDGAGLGPDGTIWGGEWLMSGYRDFERVGHLMPFALPGGDKAALEPRRSALGMLHLLHGEQAFELTGLPSLRAFNSVEMEILKVALRADMRSPRTSSVGRLFDGVASLLGLVQTHAHEGHAAMQLQFAAERSSDTRSYRYDWSREAGCLALDWRPMLAQILRDLEQGDDRTDIARRFHQTLAAALTDICRELAVSRVVLTGGCFQNRLLLTLAHDCLKAAGIRAYWPRRFPPNDGGIALGQAVVAVHRLMSKE